ncbi:MAG: hypothetical protein HOP16_02095 [Acidobacteria bacterium]|nr:hypothetical protein [Acidobacteriota bacterium]
MSVPAADRPAPERAAVMVAAGAIFILALAWRLLTFTGFTNDHYAHYALAQQMMLGDRPIRDFTDPGWPLTYALSAAAWWLAGSAMWVEWLLSSGALAAGALLTVVVAARLSGSVWIAVFVAALELISYPRTYAYPKIFVYALGAWVMVTMASRLSARRVVFMAGIVAMAFLLRHDHGLYLGIAAAVCVAVASRSDGARAAFVRAATLTATTALWLLPWMLFVTANGGLSAYFDRAIEYAQAEANASNLRSLPRFARLPDMPLLGLERPNRPLAQVTWKPALSDSERSALERRYGLEFVRDGDEARWYYAHDSSEATLDALSRDPQVEGTGNLGRVHRPIWREVAASLSPLRLAPALHSAANADAWLFWLFWGLPLVCGLVAAWRAVHGLERWPGELAVIAAICVTAAMVNAGFLRDALRTRLADAIVPAVLLGAWGLGLCWTERWRSRALQCGVALITVAACIASYAAVRQIGEWPERTEVAGIGDGPRGVLARAREVSLLLALPHRQNVVPPSRVSGALMPFFKYLDRCTSESERIIVTGEFPDVPVMAGRRFASDGVVLGAWYSSASHQDQTVEMLRTRRPLFVAYMSAGAFRSRFPLIETFVSGEYRSMTDVQVDGDATVPILVDRTRMPLGTDAETGWPCFKPAT